MVFVLPPKSQVGYLDPEIAGEGVKAVILSDGEQVTYEVPAAKPVMPDWSKIKTIAHYFGRKGYAVYPAWLFHPTEPARLVKNADEASQLGVCYRKTTQDEKSRFGLADVWDWTDETKWRPKPFTDPKFDPAKGEQGKFFVAAPLDPALAQSRLLAELIPAVAAAVMKANGGAAPANIDPAQYQEFLKFQAWQKSQEAIHALATENADNALGMSDEELRTELAALAAEKGIKVKKSWTVDDLKAALDKAA